MELFDIVDDLVDFKVVQKRVEQNNSLLLDADVNRGDLIVIFEDGDLEHGLLGV